MLKAVSVGARQHAWRVRASEQRCLSKGRCWQPKHLKLRKDPSKSITHQNLLCTWSSCRLINVLDRQTCHQRQVSKQGCAQQRTLTRKFSACAAILSLTAALPCCSSMDTLYAAQVCHHTLGFVSAHQSFYCACNRASLYCARSGNTACMCNPHWMSWDMRGGSRYQLA